MADYRKTIEARQQEADRITAELKKAESRVTQLKQRLARKNKEIRDLLKADQEQWFKLLMDQLDTAFKERKGEHYWQDMAHEDIAALVREKLAGSDAAGELSLAEDEGASRKPETAEDTEADG